jgi:hypothetical protein
MRQPPTHDREPSRNPDTTTTIILLLAVAGLLVLITLGALALGGRLSLPQAATSIPGVAAARSTDPAPTLFIPTVACAAPSLVLGTVTYRVQNTQLNTDGTVSVPPDSNGTIYWVEGTDLEYRFMLSPTVENLNLITSLPEGSSATVTWADCSSMTFTLSAPQPGDFGITYLPEQSTASILIFLQLDPTGEGFMVGGSLAEEVISVLNTPAPDESGVLAEIGLMDMTSDGSTVTLTVSVYNFGSEPFTLSAENVALTPAGGLPLEMARSSPRLPERIDPAETETFTFTFPRPSTPASTLRVFTVEYDVEGY